MLTIYGRYANAIVYTVESEQYAFDEHTRKQIQMLCNNPCMEGCKIRIMPDVHPSKISVVGFTMTVCDKIMPSLVGVDIGCGMTLYKIKAKNIEFQHLDKVVKGVIPVGGNARKNCHKYVDNIHLESLRCYKYIDSCKAELSIGTLGGGNHFIELDKDDDGNIYLIIHSGSRHLGIDVANYYLKVGQKYAQSQKQGGFNSYDMTIISDELMDDYLHDIAIVQEYADINRMAMGDEIIKNMKWKELESYSCIHNYIDFSHTQPILRKGAISAKEGEKVIIPANMRDGVILGTGLGNAEWNYSAPHGSGRVYARSEVKEHHTVSEFKQAMNGIYSSCVNKNTLDESPFAYRNINDIANAISETVKIDKIIKPIYNFKAGCDD